MKTYGRQIQELEAHIDHVQDRVDHLRDDLVELKDFTKTTLLGHIEERLKQLESYLNIERVKDPLIRDDKIREITRLWAKTNGATELKYFEGENCLEDIFRNEIHFNQLLCLEDGKTYTTDELCGEDEE